jgi:hypothetical protein
MLKLVPLLLLAQAQPLWLTLSLADRETVPKATSPEWVRRVDGFETAEIDAVLNGIKVDHFHLIRADPAKVRFTVRNAPGGPMTADRWLDELHALAVVNGSFYKLDNTPETPVRSEGRNVGPAGWATRHGAFVAKDGFATILDLAGKSVDASISPFPNAMVSYPLLVDASGKVRAQGKPTWLANRTFVAVDSKGRILIGTTETGFFALTRLGKFLKAAPLDVKLALNLDGGPVACQAVRAGGYEKIFYGLWELNDSSGEETVYWGEGDRQKWQLPVVLAVLPQRAK